MEDNDFRFSYTQSELANIIAARNILEFTDGTAVPEKIPHVLLPYALMYIALLFVFWMFTGDFIQLQLSRFSGGYQESPAVITDVVVKKKTTHNHHHDRIGGSAKINKTEKFYTVWAKNSEGISFKFFDTHVYHKGDQITVVYDRDNPSRSMIKSSRNYLKSGFKLIALTFAVIVVFVTTFRHGMSLYHMSKTVERNMYVEVRCIERFERHRVRCKGRLSMYKTVYMPYYEMQAGMQHVVFRGTAMNEEPVPEEINRKYITRIYMWDIGNPHDNRYYVQEIPR